MTRLLVPAASIEVHREGELFVARCTYPECASQGETIPVALRNLAEALELLIEDQP